MFVVYALFNLKHNKIYIGQTDNLEERITAHKEHCFSKCYTARFDGDWEIVYRENCDSRNFAIKREKQLKSYRGRQYIRSLIIE